MCHAKNKTKNSPNHRTKKIVKITKRYKMRDNREKKITSKCSFNKIEHHFNLM